MGRGILTFSDDPSIRDILARLISTAGFARCENGDTPAAILLGCSNRIAKNDLELARNAASGKAVPIILVTANGSEELAIQALRAGIANYLRLPLTAGQLTRAIEEATRGRTPVAADDRIIGTSDAIRGVKISLARAAACASNVLITGETGTGKELAADMIHRQSSRASKPFIAINCAAIPDSLLESELFGFERSAFTGAVAAQDGKLKLAASGTVFLDEIGDLSPFAQAKILRAIEMGEIQKLGGRQPQKIDVRIIAATNRDLETEPNFRRDLYFRLNVARIHMPPLRERREDIMLLAEAFRGEFNERFGCASRTFAAGVRESLMAYTWPGNIRELRNIIESAFIDPGPDGEGRINLPLRFRNAIETCPPDEHERILSALLKTEWNRSRAAEELHWSRMTLYRKMARHGISRGAA